MAILQPSDFLNNPLFDIANTRQSEKELHLMIDDVEEDILVDLLGCDLYDLFIADLTATTPQTPQSAIYLNIFNKFCFDDSCGIHKSKGMRDMLMAFVYFNWHTYNPNKSTSTGIVRGDSENSNSVSPDAFGIYEKYNRGVDTYCSIQKYICDNSTDYPEFNGVPKRYTSNI